MTTAPTLTPIPSRRTVGNAQRWGWIYQRVSGLILIVLAFIVGPGGYSIFK